MGNRAVITTEKKDLGVYTHWNGGRDSIEAALKYCELKGFRSPDTDCYGWARLCEVLCNYHSDGLSVGIERYTTDAGMNPGDNGIYIIRGWEIVDRVYPYEDFTDADEQRSYPLFEMLMDYDDAMPARMRLGEDRIREALGMPEDHASHDKLVLAAKAFLEAKGMEVQEGYETRGFKADLIAVDEKDNCLVFVAVREGFNGFNNEDREGFEKMSAEYLKKHPQDPRSVRLDVISVKVLSEDKAYVRYHANALGL